MSVLPFLLILFGFVAVGLAVSIKRRSSVWIRAFALPLLAGVAGWLSSAATISVDSCRTGEKSGSVIALVLLAAMVFAPAVIVGWHARHARPVLIRVLPPILSVCLSIVLVLVGTHVWWYGHDCYT
jgi:hypothetical protein